MRLLPHLKYPKMRLMVEMSEIIDRTYQIMKRIGSGANGIVYCAYHLRLQKYVVLKQIKQRNLDLETLRNEVDTLKGLHHTYLPQVYDFIECDGALFSVMDYIEGSDIETLLSNGYVPSTEEVIRWMRQMAEVLSYLHGQVKPVLHGDIKPSNIMIRPNGDICLIDFGISVNDATGGGILGYTGAYASPEQFARAQCYRSGGDCRQITLDARSDIYSLGATFYQIISGCVPNSCIVGNTPLLEMRKPYGEGLASIVDRAMQINPELRFANADVLKHEIERLERNTDSYRLMRFLRIITGFAAVLLIGIGAILCIHGVELRKEERFKAAYQSLEVSYSENDTDQTIRNAFALLQEKDYQKLLKKEPQRRGTVYHVLGDCYFDGENYSAAVIYYEKAIQFCGDEEIAQYYYDYVLALAWNGQLQDAADMLNRARLYGEKQETLLISAELSCLNGEYEAANQMLESLLATNISADEKCRCYLLQAEIARRCGDWQTMLTILAKAEALVPSKIVYRRYGQAYIIAANATSRGTSRNSYLNSAKAYYEKLCKMQFPSYADRLNLAIVYEELGSYEEAKNILLELLTYGEDYRTYAYLAFAYDALLQRSEAAQYCRMARRLYAEAENRENEWSDSIQHLFALCEKYGIGDEPQ